MGPSLGDTRSTSASGFNLSPPSMGPMGNTSPLGSSFGIASSFNGSRQPSSHQPSTGSQSFFDSKFFESNLSSQTVNGPTPPAMAPNAATMAMGSNSNFAATLAMEMQRLREENTVQKNTLQNYEEKVSQMINVCYDFVFAFLMFLTFIIFVGLGLSTWN